MHSRQAIREAVKNALVNKTAAQERVFETRVIPFRQTELPAIAVYTLQESIDPESRLKTPRELDRELQLVVEAAVKDGANIDDALDDICEEIEGTLHLDDTFGGTASDSVLSSVELEVFEEGQKHIGLARLTYTVLYKTDPPVPDEEDDFKTADIKYSLSNNVHSDDQAHDVLEDLDE